MKKILFLILIFALLCACSDKPAEDGQTAASPTPDTQTRPQSATPSPGGDNTADDTPATDGVQGFLFTAYGQDIYVCAEAAPILAELPEPRDVFESPSCAFEGVDITYFYPGFELTTYPENGKEHVLSVVLTDDSVTTPGGVYLGGTLSGIEKAYGADYTENGSQVTYSNGRGDLVFSLEGDVIIGIMYTLVVGG